MTNGSGCSKLTPRQRAFVQEYLVDLNATQAAIRAGYSERTAAVLGTRQLRKVHVAAAVEQANAARQKRTQISQDRVLQELARLAFSNIGDVVSWDDSGTTVQPSEGLPDDAIRALVEITDVVEKDGKRTLKVKVFDKIRALELVMKHLAMFGGAPRDGKVKSVVLRVVYDDFEPGEFVDPLELGEGAVQ